MGAGLGRLYAVARVACVYKGKLGHMTDKHSGMNHGVCHSGNSSMRRRALYTILERVYSRHVDGDDVCTVVYLLVED